MSIHYLSPSDFDASELARQMDAVFGEPSESSHHSQRSVNYSAPPLAVDPVGPSSRQFLPASKASSPYFLTFATDSARDKSSGDDQFPRLRARWDQLIADDRTHAGALSIQSRRKVTRAPMLAREADVVITVRQMSALRSSAVVGERAPVSSVLQPDSQATLPPPAAKESSTKSGKKHRRSHSVLKATDPATSADPAATAPPPAPSPVKEDPAPPRAKTPTKVEAKPEAKPEEPARKKSDTAEPPRAQVQIPVAVPPKVVPPPPPQVEAAPARLARPAQGLAAGLAARMAALGNIPQPGQARQERQETEEEAKAAAPAPQIVRCARKKGAARPPAKALQT
jgi:hypothetical protein